MFRNLARIGYPCGVYHFRCTRCVTVGTEQLCVQMMGVPILLFLHKRGKGIEVGVLWMWAVLFKSYSLRDCRNSTNRAPATKSNVPGLYGPAFFLFDIFEISDPLSPMLNSIRKLGMRWSRYVVVGGI